MPDFLEEELILGGTHSTACFCLSDSEILGGEHYLSHGDGIMPLEKAREAFCLNAADAVMEAIEHFGAETKLFPLCRAAGELSPHRMFANRIAEWGQAAAQRLGEWVGENLIRFSERASAAGDAKAPNLRIF